MNTLPKVLAITMFVLSRGKTAFTGPVIKMIAEDNDDNDEIDTPNDDKSTELYIIPHEKGHFLCNAYSINPLESNYTELLVPVHADAPSSWYSSVKDHVKVPLIIGYNRSIHDECQNKTNLRYRDSIMDEIMCIAITNNFIGELKNFTFVRFYNLIHLVLSNNNIESVARNAFYNLTHLVTLDLSSNNMKIFDLDHFLSSVVVSSGSRQLYYIDISFNNISKFTCSAKSNIMMLSEYLNHSLTLNVSYNNISTIDQSCADKIQTDYKNITLVINGVPMNCNCSTRQSSMTNDIDLHNCTCPETETDVLFSLNLTNVFALVILILIAAFVFYICVRNKGTRRITPPYCSETFCTNVIQNIKKDPRTSKTGKRSYSYVYIVASSKDSDMIDKFVEELESKRNIPLIFKERDEVPGYFKLDLFRKWIHSSTRTVFLISSNFFHDSVCTHIFNQAKAIELAEKRIIVVIIKLTDQLTQVETERMSDLLLSNSIYLNYAPSEDFWSKLVEIINNNEMHVHVSNTG